MVFEEERDRLNDIVSELILKATDLKDQMQEIDTFGGDQDHYRKIRFAKKETQAKIRRAKSEVRGLICGYGLGFGEGKKKSAEVNQKADSRMLQQSIAHKKTVARLSLLITKEAKRASALLRWIGGEFPDRVLASIHFLASYDAEEVEGTIALSDESRQSDPVVGCPSTTFDAETECCLLCGERH